LSFLNQHSRLTSLEIFFNLLFKLRGPMAGQVLKRVFEQLYEWVDGVQE